MQLHYLEPSYLKKKTFFPSNYPKTLSLKTRTLFSPVGGEGGTNLARQGGTRLTRVGPGSPGGHPRSPGWDPARILE